MQLLLVRKPLPIVTILPEILLLLLYNRTLFSAIHYIMESKVTPVYFTQISNLMHK